jgi:putative ABC transport system substrate-binding protein
MVAIDYDPVALGYVQSLARPGGNITGVYLDTIELAAKRAQLLKEAAPAPLGSSSFGTRLGATASR